MIGNLRLELIELPAEESTGTSVADPGFSISLGIADKAGMMG